MTLYPSSHPNTEYRYTIVKMGTFQILPGMDYSLGGKDSCRVGKYLNFIHLRHFVLQGDSGGPLWVREEEGGEKVAYLVGTLAIGISWSS